MTEHVIRPLTLDTYPAWLALAQKHNGVWGGCYCSYFHGDTETTVKADVDGPTFKRRMIEEGIAHAHSCSQVIRQSRGANTAARPSCPASTTARSTTPGESHPAPWRITCFFVDRDHRRSGVAREALDGALDLIAQAGGGEVVSFPNIVEPGKKVSASFLHNVTPGMFEEAGFTFERRIGRNKTVMRKVVSPS